MPCRLTDKPLTEQAKGSNRTKSTVRVRPSRACQGMHCQAVIEHIWRSLPTCALRQVTRLSYAMGIILSDQCRLALGL